jgi:RNA polymerase sigma factor (sigma-70 family)
MHGQPSGASRASAASRHEYRSRKSLTEILKTTRWSIVSEAGGGGDGANAALSVLCQTYRPAVIAYVRAHVVRQDDIEDLAQGFFEHLLSSNLPGRADPRRGRFRAFLFTSLRNFIRNAAEHDAAARRGGHAQKLPAEVLDNIESSDADPQRAFEIEWARVVLRQSLDMLQEEAQRAGRADLYGQLSPFLVEVPDADEYEELARRNGMRRNTVAVAVHRLRSRLKEIVRDVLAETTTDPSEVDVELRFFREVLADKRG